MYPPLRQSLDAYLYAELNFSTTASTKLPTCDALAPVNVRRGFEDSSSTLSIPLRSVAHALQLKAREILRIQTVSVSGEEESFLDTNERL